MVPPYPLKGDSAIIMFFACAALYKKVFKPANNDNADSRVYDGL